MSERREGGAQREGSAAAQDAHLAHLVSLAQYTATVLRAAAAKRNGELALRGGKVQTGA